MRSTFYYKSQQDTCQPPEGEYVATFQFSLWTREDGHSCVFKECRTGKCFVLHVYDADLAEKYGKPVSSEQVLEFFRGCVAFNPYRIVTRRAENGDLVWEGIEPFSWRSAKRRR